MRRIPTLTAAALVLTLLLAACGGGGDDAAPVGAGSGDQVTIEGFTFKPASITVPAGTTVTWTNKDGFAHTVKPTDDLFPASPDIEDASPFQHRYDTAGNYPYICGIHNSMTGTVVVT